MIMTMPAILSHQRTDPIATTERVHGPSQGPRAAAGEIRTGARGEERVVWLS